MNSSDLVADLRAEVTFWCRQLQDKLKKDTQLVDGSSQHTPLSPFSSQLHPPFRLISQGHELTPDLDEKSLAEVGFKDLQVQWKVLWFDCIFFFFLFSVKVKMFARKWLGLWLQPLPSSSHDTTTPLPPHTHIPTLTNAPVAICAILFFFSFCWMSSNASVFNWVLFHPFRSLSLYLLELLEETDIMTVVTFLRLLYHRRNGIPHPW